ncbi:MAG: hypothetical protein M1118_09845 [Chloroflexi bacterium]|nr:hypothetical protein [Chloroflexota bacterium]
MLNRERRWGPGSWAVVALASAVIVAVAGWAVAWSFGPAGGAGYGYAGGIMPWGWGWMGAAMPIMLLTMLLFWLAVILGIVALVRWAVDLPSRRTPDRRDALDIARERYAKGEITREAYEHLRDALTERPDRVA